MAIHISTLNGGDITVGTSGGSPTPVEHADTWYKYLGDTEWRTISINEEICGDIDEATPTTQIPGITNVVSLEIGTDITHITDAAFFNCSSLTNVIIPNSVNVIGSEVFFGCTSLTSVAIPNSVTKIKGEAFSGCSGLTSVTIPNSVESIGTYAFSGCNSLTSVTIPNSVTNIGANAFRGCSGLTSVTIVANGGNAEDVKQAMIDVGVDENITWNMPS